MQNATRARMLRQNDPYWRERQRDLDDLSDRLMRILAGVWQFRDAAANELPPDTVLVARTMGPAELLDYDRTRLRGLVIEEGSRQSHVAIVAKALGIAAIGQAQAASIERVNPGDSCIVDAEQGEVHLRPSQRSHCRLLRQGPLPRPPAEAVRALRDVPALTKDGVRIELHMNAGLLVDMPHLEESGADGIGLFRTELQFMLSQTFPRLDRQVAAVSRSSGRGRRQTGRVPHSRHRRRQGCCPTSAGRQEENPALGWRAIRMSLDRPALFRTQVRAFLRAAAGGELRIMIPMVTLASEMDDVRAEIDRESALMERWGHQGPKQVLVGAMLEVPSLLFELDAVMQKVDFISVGSNDLSQFLFAADRSNPRISGRYDVLSTPMLRALRSIVKAGKKHRVPVTLCGEMAGRPLEAMALIGLGFRSISMAPASIGPVKSMILSLDAGRVTALVEELLKNGSDDVRRALERFAEGDSVEI